MFFFFKQKTAYEIKECDWSSDVCSSDLYGLAPESRAMRDFIRYWLPVVLMAALIFVGSSISAPPPVAVDIPHLDKGIHLMEYALLSFLLKRALSRGKSDGMRKASLWAVIWTILYGITDEFHQSLVPNRQMSGFDLLFDGFGAILGQSLHSLYLRKTMHKPSCHRREGSETRKLKY